MFKNNYGFIVFSSMLDSKMFKHHVFYCVFIDVGFKHVKQPLVLLRVVIDVEFNPIKTQRFDCVFIDLGFKHVKKQTIVFFCGIIDV